ncbi:MAG: tetratricopeptide repeat protein, partial [Myxococcota bacterium]
MPPSRPSKAHDVLLRAHDVEPSDASRTALLTAMVVEGDRATELADAGQTDAARRALETAVHLGRAVHPDGAGALGPFYAALARLLEASDAAAAEAHYREAMAHEGPWTLAVRRRLAALLHRAGRLTEAEELYREALVQPGRDPATVATLSNNLATLLWQTGRPGEAIERAEQALAIQRARLAAGDAQRLRQELDTAVLWAASGRPEAAIGLFLGVLEHREAWTEASLGLGEALLQVGRVEDALAAFERAEATLGVSATAGDLTRVAMGRGRALLATRLVDAAIDAVAELPDSETLAGHLVPLLHEAGRFEDAADRAAELGDGVTTGQLLLRTGQITAAREILSEASQCGDPTATIALARIQWILGAPDDAARSAREADARLANRGDDAAPDWMALASVQSALGDVDEAERLLRRALAATARRHGITHPQAGRVLEELARLLGSVGRHAESVVSWDHARILAEHARGVDHPLTRRRRGAWAHALATVGRADEAASAMEQTEARVTAARPDRHPDVGDVAADRAAVLAAAGRHGEAERSYIHAIQAHSMAWGHEDPTVGREWRALADIRVRRRRLSEAHVALDRALAVEELVLGRALLHGSPDDRRGALEQAESSLAASITLHLRWRPESVSSARLALRTVLRRKGRAVEWGRDALATVRDGPGRATLTRCRDAVAQHARIRAHVPRDAASFDAWQHERSAIDAELAEAEAELVDASGAAGPVVGVSAVAEALGPNRALLELVEYTPTAFDGDGPPVRRIAAYLLRPGEGSPTILGRDLGPADA